MAVCGDVDVVRLAPFGSLEIELARLWVSSVAPASRPEATDK